MSMIHKQITVAKKIQLRPVNMQIFPMQIVLLSGKDLYIIVVEGDDLS